MQVLERIFANYYKQRIRASVKEDGVSRAGVSGASVRRPHSSGTGRRARLRLRSHSPRSIATQGKRQTERGLRETHLPGDVRDVLRNNFC